MSAWRGEQKCRWQKESFLMKYSANKTQITWHCNPSFSSRQRCSNYNLRCSPVVCVCSVCACVSLTPRGHNPPWVMAPLERQRAALLVQTPRFSPFHSPLSFVLPLVFFFPPLMSRVPLLLVFLSPWLFVFAPRVTRRHVWHTETATRQDASCQLPHQSIMCNFIRLTWEFVCVCVYAHKQEWPRWPRAGDCY